ncbi:Putative ribonuclease H protein At1g65750, partial [Linum perenne]
LTNNLDEIPVGWLSQGPPTPLWPLTSSGIFSVSSLYRSLCPQEYPGLIEFPASFVWKAAVPTKISGFVWLAFLRRVSTLDNLQRRGFIGPNFCVMCRADLESVSHLLLSCPFADFVWATFSSKLAIWGPFPNDTQEFIHSWQARNFSRRWRAFLELSLHAIFWAIWLERNARIFRDRERSPRQILWKVAFSVGRWLRASGDISHDDFREWLSLWSGYHVTG